MGVPAFADLAKAARETFSGGKGGGVFQYDQKVTATSKTADGVSLTSTFVNKGTKADVSLKAAYSFKNYSVDAVVSNAEKVPISLSVADLTPGLKLTGSVTLPDTSSGKLAIDYANPYLNVKTSVGLTSTPKVDFSVSTGFQQTLVGGQAVYDTAKSTITSFKVGAAYHAPDSQFGATVDQDNTVQLFASHNISRDKAVAVEATKKLAGGDTTIALGLRRTLVNGAVTKVKVDNTGVLAALYETRLVSGEKVCVAAELDTLNLSKAPKYGWALELS